MRTNSDYPIEVPAIKVEQPLGEFYVTRLPARLLLDVTFSDPLTVVDQASDSSGYDFRGTQRQEKLDRLKDIARFIDTAESAFPNSIILGANYAPDGVLVEDESVRWRVERTSADCLKLIIPTIRKLGAIVDGQHRLHGFNFASSERRSMAVLCSVYLDLPQPFQAFLFATINFNQVKVDRSLAYELFGFSLANEPPPSWSPDKTAVFLCRKLNSETDSPFFRRIRVAAENSDVLFANGAESTDWMVSTATVVDGILRLISSNPKRDKDEMHKVSLEDGRNRSQLQADKSPLRSLYLQNNDLAVYTAVKNFGLAAEEVFWKRRVGNSYIVKTVGIQALFDVLRKVLAGFEGRKDISIKYFVSALEPAQKIDFSDSFFQASGKGRGRIKNAIEFARGGVQLSELPDDDRPHYERLVKGLQS
jgi:DNA phosphorothioation-associated DGQHR protein 1